MRCDSVRGTCEGSEEVERENVEVRSTHGDVRGASKKMEECVNCGSVEGKGEGADGGDMDMEGEDVESVGNEVGGRRVDVCSVEGKVAIDVGDEGKRGAEELDNLSPPA